MTEHAQDFPDVTTLSFEDALKELENVVRRLEEGRLPLEDAIDSYARGASLKERCEALLSQARLKVEAVLAAADASITTQPMLSTQTDANND